MDSEKVDINKGVHLNRLTNDDQLKHYQEGRTDVRAYATFLIQIITLLLTTMILVMGWVAKDYATEKYKAAQNQVDITINSKIAALKALPQDKKRNIALSKDLSLQVDSRMKEIDRTYWDLIIDSPTTSLLLAGACGFMLIILGVLISVTYQLQRRRYHYHALGRKLGFESDQSIEDVVLIGGALNDLMIVIGIVAGGLTFTYFAQTIFYLIHSHSVLAKVALVFMILVVLAKLILVSQMVGSYTRFERTEGWEARWDRAAHLVKRISITLDNHSSLKKDILPILLELNGLCKAKGKESWRNAKNPLIKLIKWQIHTDLQPEIGDEVKALLLTLRHKKLLRKYKKSFNA